MIADTKQIRQVINQAIAEVGTSHMGTWTNGYLNGAGGTRTIGYRLFQSKVLNVAAVARKLAKKLDYSNEIRVTTSAYGACYVRATAFLD